MRKWLKRIFRPRAFEIEEYNARVEKSIQEHWKDAPVKIRHLVWERWERPPSEGEKNRDFNFLIFIDPEGDIDWLCDDGRSENRLEPETCALVARIMDLEARPCRHLGPRIWMPFKKMLGNAILSAFLGEPGGAAALMDEARDYLDKRTAECSRRWILLAAAVFSLLAAAAHILLWRVCGLSCWPCLFGLAGAYTAVVRRTGGLSLDASAGTGLHAAETAVRLSIGMILGLAGVSLFQSSLAPRLANDLCATAPGRMVTAFAAGLIDGFIPSMVSAYVVSPLRKEAA